MIMISTGQERIPPGGRGGNKGGSAGATEQWEACGMWEIRFARETGGGLGRGRVRGGNDQFCFSLPTVRVFLPTGPVLAAA